MYYLATGWHSLTSSDQRCSAEEKNKGLQVLLGCHVTLSVQSPDTKYQELLFFFCLARFQIIMNRSTESIIFRNFYLPRQNKYHCQPTIVVACSGVNIWYVMEDEVDTTLRIRAWKVLSNMTPWRNLAERIQCDDLNKCRPFRRNCAGHVMFSLIANELVIRSTRPPST